MANKSQIIHVAVEPSMWREMRGYAQKAGFGLSTYVRILIMQHIADKRQSKGQAA